MSEVVASLIPSCAWLPIPPCNLLVPAAASYNCTGIAWYLALPAAGIAWLNFLESPPPPCYLLACLHASSASSADEQDVRHRIFLLLNGKCLNSRFHILLIQNSSIALGDECQTGQRCWEVEFVLAGSYHPNWYNSDQKSWNFCNHLVALRPPCSSLKGLTLLIAHPWKYAQYVPIWFVTISKPPRPDSLLESWTQLEEGTRNNPYLQWGKAKCVGMDLHSISSHIV